MRPSVALRWMLRESRGAWGRTIYFAACLAVGVAAVVGTSAVSQSVEQGYRERSREILGADLSVDARRPLPAELAQVLARWPAAERTRIVETPSMAAATARGGGVAASALVQVLAIDGRYPLHGELETDPAGGLAAHLAPDTVVAAREALDVLGIEVGDELRLGGAPFRVAAAVVRSPPRFGFSALMGPRVFVNDAGFARTRLTGFGTRARYVELVAIPGGATPREIAAIEAEIRAIPGAEYLDVDTHLEAGPGGGRTARRVDGFVGLAALLSMIVGGIGVAQIVRVWTLGRTRAIAVMRCLGVRPWEIVVVSLGHTALLALGGGIVGAALGCAVPPLVAHFAGDLAAGGLPAVVPVGPVLRGVALAVVIGVVFSLPSLAAVARVSPARALRADALPLPPRRGLSALAALALAGGVHAAAFLQSGRLDWASWFTGGLATLLGLLFVAARVLVWLAAMLPRTRLNPYIRHGVAALARPGAGTTASMVALGVGAMVVVAVTLVQTRLRDGLLALVPADAPSVFLIDVQPAQWPAVESALADAGARRIEHLPVVTARIATIDGRPVEELIDEARGAGRSRRGLTREHRLTSRRDLPPSNRLVAGALWSDPARHEVSIEERFARELGVGLGSTLGFDVQGVTVELVVTSLRAVEWQSLAINFFLVAEPGVLDRAPAHILASAQVPADAERRLQGRVVAEWPNVTVIRVGAALDEVASLVRRAVGGIAVLGSFTVAAGLLVLAGAASATALRRRREVALLKTLGVTRAGVAALLAAEYGTIGAMAGLLGCAGALGLTAAFLAFVAEVPFEVPLLALPLASVACGVLAAACGVLASLGALRARPIEALR